MTISPLLCLCSMGFNAPQSNCSERLVPQMLRHHRFIASLKCGNYAHTGLTLHGADSNETFLAMATAARQIDGVRKPSMRTYTRLLGDITASNPSLRRQLLSRSFATRDESNLHKAAVVVMLSLGFDKMQHEISYLLIEPRRPQIRKLLTSMMKPAFDWAGYLDDGK